MSKSIDNSEDIIDSRDIIKRMEDLGERDDLDDDETAELASLQKLADQCDGYGEWEHGEALIRNSYFREYAEQLADNIGAIDRNATWPCNCIDWDQAARELQQDYTEVDFDGVSYFMRA